MSGRTVKAGLALVTAGFVVFGSTAGPAFAGLASNSTTDQHTTAGDTAGTDDAAGADGTAGAAGTATKSDVGRSVLLHPEQQGTAGPGNKAAKGAGSSGSSAAAGDGANAAKGATPGTATPGASSGSTGNTGSGDADAAGTGDPDGNADPADNADASGADNPAGDAGQADDANHADDADAVAANGDGDADQSGDAGATATGTAATNSTADNASTADKNGAADANADQGAGNGAGGAGEDGRADGDGTGRTGRGQQGAKRGAATVKSASSDVLDTDKRGAGKDTDAPAAVTQPVLEGPAEPADDSAAVASTTATAQPDPGVSILAVPAEPDMVSAVPLQNGIRVSWAHTGINVDHYTATAYDNAGNAGGSCTSGSSSMKTCDITSGVTAGTAYTVGVVAYGGPGTTDPSSAVSSSAVSSSTVVPGPPAKPTGVQAVGKTPTALTVSWTAPTTPASGIDHFVVTGVSDPSRTCSTANGTTTHCDVDSLTTDTAYTFTVKAIGADMNGDSDDSTASAPVKPGAPDAPTAVAAQAVAAHTLRVSWTAPAEKRGGVLKYVATSVEDPTKWCDTSDGGSDYCEVDNLAAGGPGYTFTVVAKGMGSSGDSMPSDASAVAVPAGPPDDPTALTVTVGDSTLTVQWTAPVNKGAGIDSYSVQTAEDHGRNCGVVAGTEDHCTITGLANGTAYTVQVRAEGTGASGDSSWVSAAAATPSAAPGPVTGVTATAKVEAVTVSWTAGPAGTGIAKFQAMATSSGGAQQSCETPDAATTTCTITGLTADTAYSVTVKAWGQYGRNSDWSSPAATATPTAVLVPETVPASSGSVGSSSGTDVAPGEAILVSGTGYAPNSTVKVAIYSTPAVLATTTTDGSGSFSVSVTVPDGYTGSHTLVASGVDSNGVARFLTLAVAVSGADTAGSGGASASSGTLAVTGGPVSTMALLGAGMVFAGVALTALSRVRRRRPV